MMKGHMSQPRTRAADAAHEAASSHGSLPPFELQELWFSTLRTEWSSLAIVPAHPGGSAERIAKALADVGGRHRGSPILLVKADGSDLAHTAQLVDSLSRRSGATGSNRRGGEVIVSLDPVVTNPLGIAIALAADAVLVTIELGVTDLHSARRTIELVGRERLLGCVVVNRGG
jgi:hypothetical protein